LYKNYIIVFFALPLITRYRDKTAAILHTAAAGAILSFSSN